eukprot:scaffold196351_cov30-Tisochrysis_lutea.AAC.4
MRPRPALCVSGAPSGSGTCAPGAMRASSSTCLARLAAAMRPFSPINGSEADGPGSERPPSESLITMRTRYTEGDASLGAPLACWRAFGSAGAAFARAPTEGKWMTTETSSPSNDQQPHPGRAAWPRNGSRRTSPVAK